MISSIFNWILYILKSFFQLIIIFFLIIIPFSNNQSNSFYLISNGFYIGSFYNYWNYVIETNGREFVIYDKSREYGIGVFEWWVRMDKPHFNIDFYQLNVNPRISGVRDPHTFIPYQMAMALQLTGSGLRLLNKASPFVFIAFLIDDYKNVHDLIRKNSKEGSKEAGYILLKYGISSYGAALGAHLGTAIIPGIGSLLGSLGGGVAGRLFFEELMGYLKPEIY